MSFFLLLQGVLPQDIAGIPLTWHGAYALAVTTLSGVVVWLALWVRKLQDERQSFMESQLTKQAEVHREQLNKQATAYQEIIAQVTAAVNTNTEVLRVVTTNQAANITTVQNLERTFLTKNG